jgi:hypothetical protein
LGNREIKISRFVAGLLAASAFSASALAGPIQTVFVIALENHDFTQADSSPPGSVLCQ